MQSEKDLNSGKKPDTMITEAKGWEIRIEGKERRGFSEYNHLGYYNRRERADSHNKKSKIKMYVYENMKCNRDKKEECGYMTTIIW